MKRESAVAETVAYDTTECAICDTEVALARDRDLPADAVDPQGYAVLLGEGSVETSVEDAGNWDLEVTFQLDEDDQRQPSVEGHVVCEDCAERVHGHPPDATHYHGSIPAALATDAPTVNEDTAKTALLVVATVIVGLVLLALAL